MFAPLCEAALDCQVPMTHVIEWWTTPARDLALVLRRYQRINGICAGHAALAHTAVRSGNAARYRHTPVTITGPYPPDRLARELVRRSDDRGMVAR